MVEIKHTTDASLSEAVNTLAAAFDRFTESVDRLVYIVESIAINMELPTLDDEKEEVEKQ